MSNSLFFSTFAIDTVLMSSSFDSFSCKANETLFFNSSGKLELDSFSIMTDKYFFHFKAYSYLFWVYRDLRLGSS